MVLYVVIVVFFCQATQFVAAPAPVRFTIDCSPEDHRHRSDSVKFKSKSPDVYDSDKHFDVDSFCGLLLRAIPRAIKNGKFIRLEDRDQDLIVDSDNHVPISVPAPRRFFETNPSNHKWERPRNRTPKLKIPTIDVPKLKSANVPRLAAPRIANSVIMPIYRGSHEDDSSAERMERFKKGVQRLLHVVKVLGQVDQYLSERTRIVVDKLSKTFAE